MASDQEQFWTGDFGAAYSARNAGQALVEANVALFRDVLNVAQDVQSVIEFGCNIGLNLKALKHIDPSLELAAIEINEAAAEKARALDVGTIVCDSITRNLHIGRYYDLAFTKGVLIHIHPDDLAATYANLCNASRHYVLVCEYYNPTPVEVAYRGHAGKLFKRDFAGELIDQHGLKLVDYGFVYHRDPAHPQDDVTWFLLEK